MRNKLDFHTNIYNQIKKKAKRSFLEVSYFSTTIPPFEPPMIKQSLKLVFVITTVKFG